MAELAHFRSFSALCVLLFGMAAHAAEPQHLPSLRMSGMEFTSDDSRRKISSQLIPFLGQSGPIDQRLRQTSQPASQPNLVLLRLDVPVTQVLVAAITATGVRVIETSERWNSIVVEADLTQVTPLSQITAVHSVNLLRKPRHRFAIGSYNSEADPLIHTDQVRSTFGVGGEGMTIGVMSDSIHSTTAIRGSGTVTGSAGNQHLTGSTLQSSGDLPLDILIVADDPVVVGQPNFNTDEGAGMMESVHHLAPNATCVFASCGLSPTSMAANIAKFTTARCQVACDDIGFFDEPMFQDGPIAQAANEFVALGGVYLSAAGNSGATGILATYSDVVAGNAATLDGNDFHNWGSGTSNGYLPLDVPSGETLTVIMQWNQPYHSYGLGAGSQEDFDLYLFDSSATTAILTSSTDAQGSSGSPSGDPYEALQYRNTTASTNTVFLAVNRRSNAASTARLRLTVALNGTQLMSPVFNCGTTYGHPVAQQVLGVGAAPVTNVTNMEDFSSSGGWGASGLPFYFSTTGIPLSETRNKPDLVAPDGAYNLWADSLSPTFPYFYGTSAATPHAAAAAALVWSVRPTLSNQQLMNLLRNTATDITAAPASSGDDAYSGHGLVNAMSAIGTAVTSISSSAPDGVYQSGTITVTVNFNRAVIVTGQPLLALNTSPQANAVYAGGSGSSTLSFTYTISSNDFSAKLDSASRAALTLNGGTIVDQVTTAAADLSVPTPLSSRSLAPTHAIVIDPLAPSVQLTAPSNPIGAFAFTAEFSHAVSGFTASDVTLVNATAGALTQSGNSYVLQVIPTLVTAGTISASIAAGAVTDAGGLSNSAASLSVVWQPVPTVVPPVVTPAPADAGSSGGGGLCGVGSSIAVLLGLILILRIGMFKPH